uniref:Ig-like domain-containing protein n=1 Tax=Amphiprion ocellaris TaxID=80972 RepID=A0A3Q1DEQ4_AMPOC
MIHLLMPVIKESLEQPPSQLPSGDVIAAEGDTVTLDCTFETSDRNPYLFWYKQELNDYPKYMLKKLGSGPPYKAPDFEDDRFHTEIQDKSVPLKIQKLQLSDSAVYYCALSTSQ